MKRMDRIEKSGFRKGQYVGYGSNGVVYRIHKDKGGGGVWIALAQGHYGGFYADTLIEADKKLGKL
jgi:hypothetical protein